MVGGSSGLRGGRGGVQIGGIVRRFCPQVGGQDVLDGGDGGRGDILGGVGGCVVGGGDSSGDCRGGR